MSIKAMNWAWSVERLRPVERLVLLALADYADEHASCFPSQEAIAERSCCSDRTVRRVLEMFESSEIIKRSRRYIAGERSSDRYVLAIGHRTDFPVEGHRTKHAGLPDKTEEVTGHPCPSNHQNHQNHQVPPIVPQRSSSSMAATVSEDLEAAAFQSFYSRYPRKVGKDGARKAFSKAAQRAGGFQVIIDGAQRLAQDPNLPTDRNFIPHPTTWLNQGRWEDEPLPPRAGATGGTAVERMAARMRGQQPPEGGGQRAIGA